MLFVGECVLLNGGDQDVIYSPGALAGTMCLFLFLPVVSTGCGILLGRMKS
jgi:hypothetical protein